MPLNITLKNVSEKWFPPIARQIELWANNYQRTPLVLNAAWQQLFSGSAPATWSQNCAGLTLLHGALFNVGGGLIGPGSFPLATLPAQASPLQYQSAFSTVVTSTTGPVPAQILVDPNGAVTLNLIGPGISAVHVFLDGIVYDRTTLNSGT